MDKDQNQNNMQDIEEKNESEDKTSEKIEIKKEESSVEEIKKTTYQEPTIKKEVEEEVKVEPEYKKLKVRKKGSGSYKSKLGKKRKKAKLPVKRGRAYIFATYNNTHITLTDLSGNVIASSSAGECGFRGPKKSTPYAAGIITQRAVNKAKDRGFEEAAVFVKGVGMGREAAVRSLYANGISIASIKDITPVPHNGCRPKKPRRV